MNVLLVFKLNSRTVFFPKATGVRIQRDARGVDSWVIETPDDVQLFTCANWHIYIQYNENK